MSAVRKLKPGFPLLFACFAGAVILMIAFHGTKKPSLRVGATIRDPQEYLSKHGPRVPFCVGTLVSQPGGVYTHDTSFLILGRRITSRTTLYRFDTNGTVLSIYSRRYWPIFHF